ncbi:MAG: hypothetical protein DMG76_24085 [Acidobacteria bacterium]|nr:MAG: hypothetical protein DMG76_24085 [Acidobacteriota bacterium]
MFTTRIERELRTGHVNPSSHSHWLIPGRDIREARYYGRIDDLRQYGLNSILCFGHRRTGNHKLEIIGTGTMMLSEIVSEIKKVFELDPMQAEIMRIDFAVDAPGYPVEWFRENTRVARKRYTCDYDRVVSEHKRVETLYFGKRPNIFRVYDKTEEQRVEYRRLNSKRLAGEFIPTFEERYGHRENEILTRIERQYGGGRVPRRIANLQRLQENAISLNPFEPPVVSAGHDFRAICQRTCRRCIHKRSRNPEADRNARIPRGKAAHGQKDLPQHCPAVRPTEKFNLF